MTNTTAKHDEMTAWADGWTLLVAYNLSIDHLLESTGMEPNSHWFDPKTELCLVISFCCALLLGLLGNVLVALVVCRRNNLRSVRNWYVLNLVASDILTCLLCVPFILLRLTLKNWPLGELLCRTAPALQLTYVFVSIFTILAIAVERYRSIVCSNRSQPDRRLIRIVIPAIWLLSAGLALPLAINHRLERVQTVTGHVLLTLCVEFWESDTLLYVYTVCILLIQYALPATTIAVLHLLICRYLRMRVQLRGSKKCSRNKLVRHKKNLVLLSVSSIAFAVEWLPLTSVNLLVDFDHTVFPSPSHFCLTYALCLLFALSSVFVNPVVYGWFNSNFRRDLCSYCGGGALLQTSEITTGQPESQEATSRLNTVVGAQSSTSERQHSCSDNILTMF